MRRRGKEETQSCDYTKGFNWRQLPLTVAFSGAEGILAGGTEVAQTSSPLGEFMNLSSWPLLPGSYGLCSGSPNVAWLEWPVVLRVAV